MASERSVAELAGHLLTAFQKLSIGVTPTRTEDVNPGQPEKPKELEQAGGGLSEAETVPGDCQGSVKAAVPGQALDATPAFKDTAQQSKQGLGSTSAPPLVEGKQHVANPSNAPGPSTTVQADPVQETNSSSAATLQEPLQLTQEDLKHMSEGQILLAWEQGRCPTELINTNNCRNLAMRLRRYCTTNTLTNAPNMEKLFDGSTKDKRQLLQQWLMAGENPQMLEMNLRLDREREDTEGEKWLCLTVEGMKKHGVSECLGGFGLSANLFHVGV